MLLKLKNKLCMWILALDVVLIYIFLNFQRLIETFKGNVSKWEHFFIYRLPRDF